MVRVREIRNAGLILLVLILSGGFAHPSRAADDRIDVPVLESGKKRAETLISRGKLEEAIIILEGLRDQLPNDPEVIDHLQRLYQRTRTYDKLLELMMEGLPDSEDPTRDAVVIADCFFKLKEPAAAESTLAAILEPGPDDPQIYRGIARAYMRNGRSSKAVDTYELARKQFDDPRLFTRELAGLYEARREYTNAIREYFWDLQDNPSRIRYVQRKINDIMKMEDGTEELTSALEELAEEHADNYHARSLYAELLLARGESERAWPEILAADTLDERPGEHILFYIDECLQRGFYEAARKGCADFLALYPRHQRRIDAEVYRARTHIGLGQADSAIIILRELVNIFPQPQFRAELLREIGNAYLNHLLVLDSAEHYYRQALENTNRRDDRFELAALISECLLRRGNLAGADSALASADNRKLQADQREELQYTRAELLFFSGLYDSASAALETLIESFPNGFYVNDAIVLNLQITENRDPMDWSLSRYAAGRLKLRQQRFDSARVYFTQLAEDSANGLADDALYDLGSLYRQLERPDSARAVYRMLVDHYPDRYLLPAALIALGDVYAEDLSAPEKAREAYHRVLTEFSNSPYLEEARRKMQNLVIP